MKTTKSKQQSKLQIDTIRFDLGEDANVEIGSDGYIEIHHNNQFELIVDLETYIAQLQQIVTLAKNFPALAKQFETDDETIRT